VSLFKRAVLAVLMLGAVAVYVVRAFHPEQPLHHELNDAGGVVLLSIALLWFFLPDGDD
jgi:heme/copper-type cytochrome/quinol oxidase subunit 1